MQRKWIPKNPRNNAELTPEEKLKMEIAVRTAAQLAKGFYRKPDKENGDPDDSDLAEKGNENESNHC